MNSVIYLVDTQIYIRLRRTVSCFWWVLNSSFVSEEQRHPTGKKSFSCWLASTNEQCHVFGGYSNLHSSTKNSVMFLVGSQFIICLRRTASCFWWVLNSSFVSEEHRHPTGKKSFSCWLASQMNSVMFLVGTQIYIRLRRTVSCFWWVLNSSSVSQEQRHPTGKKSFSCWLASTNEQCHVFGGYSNLHSSLKNSVIYLVGTQFKHSSTKFCII